MKKVLGLMVICGVIVGLTGCPGGTTKTTSGTGTKTTEKATTKATEKAAPEPSIKVTVAEKLDVKKGDKGTITVKIERKDFAAPEEVKIEIEEPADSKLKGTDVTIDKGKDSADITIEADKEAKAGDYKVKVNASSGKSKDSASVTVTVKE